MCPNRLALSIVYVSFLFVGISRGEDSIEHASQPKPPILEFREQPEPVAFDVGGYRGLVSLTVHPHRMKFGSSFAIETKVVNTSEAGYDIYYKARGMLFTDGFQMLCEPPSMRLAVFDGRGIYLANLFFKFNGSSRGVVAEDWWRLPPRGVMRKRHVLPPPRGDWGEVASQLGPGKYYLQVIFLDRFVSPSPFRKPGREAKTDVDADQIQRNERPELAAWFGGYSDTPLFRSNTVEIEIVDE